MKVPRVQELATAATLILLVLGIFQFLLALGMPLGRAAWGGGQSVLPLALRIGSTLSIAVYIVAIYAIRSRAGLRATSPRSRFAQYGTWTFAVFFLLGVPLNLISSSPWERFLMAPLAMVLSALFFTVAKQKE